MRVIEAFIYPVPHSKVAIRAHCERIVRTLGSERPNNNSIWTCNPLKDKANNPLDLSCSKRLDDGE